MTRRFQLTLALCWPDRTWTEDTLTVDENDLYDELPADMQPSEGELIQAADEYYDALNQSTDEEAHRILAVGLIAWEEIK